MVAMLAPRNTPRIPMYGFVENRAGVFVGDVDAASWRAAVVNGFAPESGG
jgi:hypothetical protein